MRPRIPQNSGSGSSGRETAVYLDGSTTNATTPARRTAPDPAAQARADARAAEARAVAREEASKRKAGRRMLRQAGLLDAQVKSLKTANANLGKRLQTQLGNVTTNTEAIKKELLASFTGLSKDKLGLLGDNVTAAAGQQESSFANAVRERQDAMTGLVTQGAGETDAMRAMLLAARNLNANTAEGNRAFFDTQRSINASITEMNNSTKRGLSENYRASEAERGRLYGEYYDARSENFTNIGNIRGQQADLVEQAKEMGVSAKKGQLKGYTDAMKNNYNAAAAEKGKAYKQAADPAWLTSWTGMAQQEGKRSNTNLAAAVKLGTVEKAEGSSLRRWEG